MEKKKRILFVVEAMGDVFTNIVDLANEPVKTYDLLIAYTVRPQTPRNYRFYFDKRIHLIEEKSFTRSIIPTSLWEGLPTSLLESVCMKRLCVFNDVIGNHDVIESGRNGFVYRAVDEFKKAVEVAENSSTDEMIRVAFIDKITSYNASVIGLKYAAIFGRGLYKFVFVPFLPALKGNKSRGNWSVRNAAAREAGAA